MRLIRVLVCVQAHERKNATRQCPHSHVVHVHNPNLGRSHQHHLAEDSMSCAFYDQLGSPLNITHTHSAGSVTFDASTRRPRHNTPHIYLPIHSSRSELIPQPFQVVA